MTTRTGYGRPCSVTSVAGRGPAVRAVIVLRLSDSHGFVELPRPTMQYGGILPFPPGTVLRIDIGDASHCSEWTVDLLTGALLNCAEIEIVGTDPYGVAETREVLARALHPEARRA